MFYFKALLFCLLGFLSAPGFLMAQDTPKVRPLALQPDAEFCWWRSGEPIVFKPVNGATPENLATLEGRVFDVNGNLLDTVSVSRENLEATGWVWKPGANGFYEVEFSWTDNSGKSTPVIESYWKSAPNRKKARFERKRYSVAVAAPGDAESGLVGQFGFDCESPRHIPLAKLIGFDLTRVFVGWGAVYANLTAGIEPVKGERNWERTDALIEELAGSGMRIMCQFNYTPLWASPFPEKTHVSVCVVDATTYAPKDMGDFTNFVEAAVTRYKDRVKIWEVWNEPAVPGGSLFWGDTPENYVRLLKAGYEAVKSVDPSAEVWNGGIGMRTAYYAFYEEILKLGAAPYYDKLSLHGKFMDLSTYRKIEEKYNAPHKPAVVTEWHAVLTGQSTVGDMDTETALSLRMMREMFSQIKQGIIGTMLFEMANQTETEAVTFALANRWVTHAAGLFRREPRFEPRHAAVVMATFLNLSGKKASFEKEVAVGKDGYGILLNTNKGKLLVVWNDREPGTVADLKMFSNANSTLHDWEGKTVALDGSAALELNKLYYLGAPDATALAGAASADRLVPPQREEKTSRSAPEAVFVRGEVSDGALPKDAPWIEKDWKYVSVVSKKDEKFSARALVGLGKTGVDLMVEVRDPRHVQDQKERWWEGDSLQLAIDCEGRGMFRGNVEYIAALSVGKTVFWKGAGVHTDADLPAEVSPTDGPVQSGDCKITRSGDTTTYRIRVPWGELYPMVYDPNRKLKISLLVNNNDGQGRAGYLEWSSGIGNEKNPSQYGTLNPWNGK